ncbi:cathepsin B [Ixodes scapularis]|uniref:cathepsin B n=1 Tax=Ixodes scapularis TaxID=6945 RepID=UPI001C38CE11|nr:cathepsin B [Ixodes scapularis]
MVRCFGGNSSWAWRYWRETGIVSGGLYGTQDGCKPYTLPPCDHHVEGPLPKCGEFLPTPKCVNACRDGYDRDYQHDRFYGKEVYSIGKSEKQIRVEILKNGPLQAVMLGYEDFLHYKTGVYKHVSGKLLAGHAVKIIGWGTEKGTPYWLVANSWNTHWGDKGYFKILRGSNECNIEGQIHAGIPKF